MNTKRCAACGQDFHPHPKSPRQTYCSKAECQRVRKRKWQQQKLKSDPDYAENQARAQQAWISSHADYWRQYRQEHPDYANQNREMQTGRNAKNRGKPIAKMDVWTVEIRVLERLPGQRR